jgi:hypothetical protein
MTRNLRRTIILALATLPSFAPAGSRQTAPKPSIPKQIQESMKDLIQAFAGSWAIQLTSEGSGSGVGTSAGEGEEIWRAGPGSNSLMEEYHSTGIEGEITGLGIYWWEQGGFRVFWCDNTAPVSCGTLHNKTDWKQGRLVLSEERYEKGEKLFFQETFVFDTPDSFTQTLANGKSSGSLKPFLTIRATRKHS